MLKLQIFNAKHPLETRELEFPVEESSARDIAIGSAPERDIPLTSPRIEAIAGIIRPGDKEYRFTPIAHRDDWRYNDETVEIDRSYSLQVNDILRLREYVLIVQSVPFSEKIARSPETGKSNRKSPENGNRLQQLKTRLNRKNNTPAPAPVTPAPLAVGAALPLPAAIAPIVEKDLTLCCIATIDETHDVKTFRFVADPPTRFTYKAGQFITIKPVIDGKPVTRSYSISSTPSRPDVLEITVKRVPAPPDVPDAPPGLVSNWLHDNLKAGDTLQTKGIGGNFTCVDHRSRKLLLISAGSGITPMMAMSRWVYDTGAEHDIVFFHSARDRQDIIYDRELQLLEQRNPNFHLAISLTRCQDTDWTGLTGRLDEKTVATIAPDYKERTVYVCGPDSFMKGAKELLASIDFPMDNYHEESFGGAKKPKAEKKDAPAGEKTAIVVLAKSEREIATDGSDTILDIAEEAGIDISSSCRSGNCGTCKARKLEGEVQYDSDPKGLDEAESDAGYILTCIARPVDRVVIDV
jgi:ferredoxin-NADP reductase